MILHSVFWPEENIDRRFDLKGCHGGRQENDTEDSIVLKDKNFNVKIVVTEDEKSRLLHTIENDLAFLQHSLNVMDYSLLLAFESSSLSSRESDKEDPGGRRLVPKKCNQIHPMNKKLSDCQSLADNMVPSGVHIFEGVHQLYYFGIIDIFTPYHCRQKIGRLLKTVRYCNTDHSSLPPEKYAERFQQFIQTKVLE